MSSRHNNRQPRRNLSKVEQQLAAEQAERDKAIRQQRRREYLARKEKRERNSSSGSSTKTAKSDDRPAWMVERDRQRGPKKTRPSAPPPSGNFEGNKFFIPGQKRLTKASGQSHTLGSLLPDLEKQLNSLTFAPAKATRHSGAPKPKVSKSAFAALDTDSDDEDEEQEQVTVQGPSVGSKTSAQQQQSSSAWGGFRNGIIPKEIPKYQRKPAAGVTILQEPEEVEEEESSESEEEQVGYSTEGDYEEDEDFDEDESIFDAPQDGEDVTDSWDL